MGLECGALQARIQIGVPIQSNPWPRPTAVCANLKINLNGSVSVSYTHLDVYKRQVQAQTSWSSTPQAVGVGEAAQKAGNVFSTQIEQVICPDCGQVTAVTVADKPGDSNAVGLIAGGVAGAVLGHQVGGGLSLIHI